MHVCYNEPIFQWEDCQRLIRLIKLREGEDGAGTFMHSGGGETGADIWSTIWHHLLKDKVCTPGDYEPSWSFILQVRLLLHCKVYVQGCFSRSTGQR